MLPAPNNNNFPIKVDGIDRTHNTHEVGEKCSANPKDRDSIGGLGLDRSIIFEEIERWSRLSV
jgi:hypothetical protein